MSDPLAIVRWLDLVLIVLAIPFVVLLELPVLGFAVGAGAWILQRFIGVAVDRYAKAQEDARKAIGLNFAAMLGRIWLMALGILVVGLTAERQDGLTAAVLSMILFTVYLGTTIALRPLEHGAARP